MAASTVLIAAQLSLAGMAELPAGEFRPLYLSSDSPVTVVEGYHIDQKPVSNQQFWEFVQQAPRWQKNQAPSIFADLRYLEHWHAKLIDGEITWRPTEISLDNAIVNVSWFAAQAYCQAQGKHLPTVSQWEYAAKASQLDADGSDEAEYQQKILAWYSKHEDGPVSPIASTPANFWGVYDLHGLNWEWTNDFNSALVSGESRADSAVDQKLYCAAGSVGSADVSDYAAFMRYAFRSSLEAHYDLPNLGFRCASDTTTNDQ